MIDSIEVMRMEAMNDLTVVSADDDHCAAHCEEVFFFNWRKVTHLETVIRLEQVLSIYANNFDKFALVTIVENGAALPSDDARKAVSKGLEKIAPRIVGSATLFEGKGFSNASIRYVVIGIAMKLSHMTYPYQVFISSTSAASWVSERLKTAGKSINPSRIESLMKRVRTISKTDPSALIV